MAHKFRLSPDLAKAVATLASDLQAEAAEHQAAWDERTEKWQDSEKGTAAGAWIEQLEALADELEALPEEPE